MNARAAICKAIEVHESALADLRAALDAIDGAPEARPATATNEWIDSSNAARICHVTTQTVRRWAVAYGSGRQTATGRWEHNRAAVLALSRRERADVANVARDVANVALGGIPLLAKQAHLEHVDEDET